MPEAFLLIWLLFIAVVFTTRFSEMFDPEKDWSSRAAIGFAVLMSWGGLGAFACLMQKIP